MKLEIWDEFEFTSPEALAEADRKVCASLAAALAKDRVPVLAGADVGYERAWARIRPSLHRRIDSCRPRDLFSDLERTNRWTQAGGPYMQQQALLRTFTPRVSHPQRELPEKGPT